MIQQAWIAMSNNKQVRVQEILQALQGLILFKQPFGEHLLANSRPSNNKRVNLMMSTKSLRVFSLWEMKGNSLNRKHKLEEKRRVVLVQEKLKERTYL
jgi:hypothetical protein